MPHPRPTSSPPQISLAKSTNVEGPYEKIATLLLPEAHNTQVRFRGAQYFSLT
jgi:hypothetical protein